MSTYLYGKMIVRGNAEILRDFVKYLDNEYDDEYVREGIKRGYTRDGSIEHGYLNENCFFVEGDDNYFIIDIEKLSRIFPTLKFEYISQCSDGISSSSFQICLNGKSVDYNEGNSLSFDDGCVEEERCKLCNDKLNLRGFNDGICYECIELMCALKQ